MGLEFRLLGPLEAVRDGHLVPIPAAMQRCLLACLLLEANRPVPVDALAARLWPTAPPRDVRATLRSYVMRLRKALGQDRIETTDAGYALRAEDDEIDLRRFLRLADLARAEPDPAKAARLGHDALALWRGVPLSDVPCAALRDEHLPWLTEQRLNTIENRVEEDLRIGRSGDVVAELRVLVASHPFRERFWVQLMRALAGSGRQAEALEAYQELNSLLREELGIEPSREVRELHRDVLNAEAPAPLGTPVPAQLPAEVYGFTGRDDELRSLDHLLAPLGSGTVIGALTGTAGVGKSALAVRWAHSRRSAFPDGQLYLDLCGFGPRSAIDPAEALAMMLRSLGAGVPQRLDERAAAFRSALDGRRLLILLDNAADTDQVRQLLPGSGACLVLVTSRNDLAGLVARDGARRIAIGLLTKRESRDLLGALVGDHVTADPAAADELAERCAHLPLALRIAAESATARPGSTLASVVAALSADRERRRALAAGDDAHTIHTVFSWSLGRLRPEVARTFRLLGHHRGRTFDAYTIAALTGQDVESADALAWALKRAHLIEHVDSTRYRMHDLLHGYAVALTEAAEDDAAFERLLAFYTYATSRAVNTLAPYDAHYRPAVEAGEVTAPEFPDADAAMAWLDAERQNIIVLCEDATTRDEHDRVLSISRTMWRYLDIGGYRDENRHLGELALAAATAVDSLDESYALIGVTLAIVHEGRLDEGNRHATRAVELARRAGDPHAESWALIALSIASSDLNVGLEHELESLRVSIENGDIYGECRTRANLCATHLWMGDHAASLDQSMKALRLAEEHDIPIFISRVLNNLGYLQIQLGALDEALGHLRQALEVGFATGDRTSRGYVLSNIGFIHLRQGHYAEATLELRQALDLAEVVGDLSLQSGTRNKLGELARRTGRAQVAVEQYGLALDLARRLGVSIDVVDAQRGLVHALLDLGEDERARREWEDAERLAAEHGVSPDEDLAARVDQSG